MLLIIIVSCNSIKKSENKVLNNPESRKRIFRAIEPEFPCNNDTIVISNSDTTIITDTLYNIYTDTVIVEGATKVIIKQVPNIVTKTIKIRDTVNNYIVDNRRLNIALDSVNYYKGLTQQFKAKYEQQKQETKEQRARGNKWILYFILLFAASLISHYLRSKL